MHELVKPPEFDELVAILRREANKQPKSPIPLPPKGRCCYPFCFKCGKHFAGVTGEVNECPNCEKGA